MKISAFYYFRYFSSGPQDHNVANKIAGCTVLAEYAELEVTQAIMKLFANYTIFPII